MVGAADNLEPDIVVGSLEMWVRGRACPGAQDYWDGNWLDVTARVATAGAEVEASGTIVHLGEIKRFLEACRVLYAVVDGEARLACMEPNLGVVIHCSPRGHVSATIAITPDHMTQRHEFREEFDQTFLPAIIQSLENVLLRLPIRGSAPQSV